MRMYYHDNVDDHLCTYHFFKNLSKKTYMYVHTYMLRDKVRYFDYNYNIGAKIRDSESTCPIFSINYPQFSQSKCTYLCSS